VVPLNSQPSAGLPLQSMNPGLHTYPHVPLLQNAVALVTGPHGCPHVPQFWTLLFRFVSQPVAYLPSQSA
jgi:hypothetical protein